MRNITIELSREHQNILKVIDLVLDECTKIENGKSLKNGFFEDVVLFIRKYADGYHHAKEEDVLFKAMLSNLHNMHCNPIPVMLNEHDAGRNYVKGMVTALEDNNKEELLLNARGYCYLLQNHIYKEDNVLYPMAEEALDEQQKNEVEDSYLRISLNDFIDSDIESFIKNLQAKAN